MTPKQAITQVAENWDNGDPDAPYLMEDAIKEWSNCQRVCIDVQTGEVWIDTPQTGHWLDDHEAKKFLLWLHANDM